MFGFREEVVTADLIVQFVMDFACCPNIRLVNNHQEQSTESAILDAWLMTPNKPEFLYAFNGWLAGTARYPGVMGGIEEWVTILKEANMLWETSDVSRHMH